jgi:hypothetical protein
MNYLARKRCTYPGQSTIFDNRILAGQVHLATSIPRSRPACRQPCERRRPTAGLDGLADYTGAAACALATGSDMQDSACRAGTQATDRAAAATATESAATTGHDPASGDTATAPTGVVADRRPADCPSTSRAADGQGADDAGVATTVDEARDEDGGSDRQRRDTDTDADDDDADLSSACPRSAANTASAAWPAGPPVRR